MKTTVDIDDALLHKLSVLQASRGISLSEVISELLEDALRWKQTSKSMHASGSWIAREMGARVDLADPDAVWSAMSG